MLLEAKAAVDLQDDAGRSALHSVGASEECLSLVVGVQVN